MKSFPDAAFSDDVYSLYGFLKSTVNDKSVMAEYYNKSGLFLSEVGMNTFLYIESTVDRELTFHPKVKELVENAIYAPESFSVT